MQAPEVFLLPKLHGTFKELFVFFVVGLSMAPERVPGPAEVETCPGLQTAG